MALYGTPLNYYTVQIASFIQVNIVTFLSPHKLGVVDRKIIT